MFRSILGSVAGKVAGFWLGNKISVVLWAVVVLFVGASLWTIKAGYDRMQRLEQDNAILLDRNANLKASREHLVQLNRETVQRWKLSQKKEYMARRAATERAKERLSLIRSLRAKMDHLKTITRPQNEKDCAVHPAIVSAFELLYPKAPATGAIVGGAGKGD